MILSKIKTIHELFEEQAKKTPNRISVIHQGDNLTYAELNTKANILASQLRLSGVMPNDIVALLMERSLDIFIGIFAILKAGGCYLPIDPTYPPERIKYMLEDSKCSVMVTQNEVNMETDFTGHIFCIDDPDLYTKEDRNLEPVNTPEDLIYVLYTSGSTGNPKGVMVEHRAVYNFIKGVTNEIEFKSDDTIVCLTTISFDIFVLETLLPLSEGLRVVLADPMTLLHDIGTNQIDMLQTTPSTMQVILNDRNTLDFISKLKVIMLGGESFPKRLLQQLRALSNAKVYNMYGPTETTVWSAIKDLTFSSQITIGPPMLNTQFYVVDDQLKIVPPGEVGELCISGLGVARGYLHNPELTRERFIQNSIFQNQMTYRTGDMVKALSNGELEFLGRVDNQIKVRGFRIELGEVEETLYQFPGLRDCSVAVKADTDGEKYLVGYYVSNTDIVVSELIQFLKERLPEYMIPGFYMRVPEIPLTPNGKVDRKALPEYNKERPILASEFIPPETELENRISELWRQVLQRDIVGTQDNFFELGGNSILLSALVSKMNDVFPEQIGIPDLFSNPTIEKQACFLQGRSNDYYPELMSLSLPSEYYYTNELVQKKIKLSLRLDAKTYYDLVQLSSRINTDSSSIFLSLYASLISEISNQEKLSIVVFEKSNDYSLIHFDFSKITTLEEILQQTKIRSHPLRIIEEKRNKSRSAIPFFSFESEEPLDKIKAMEINKGFALYITTEDEQLTCELQFLSSFFSEAKMNELLQFYIQMLTAISKDT